MRPQQVLIALAAAVPFVAAAQPESDLGCFSQVPSLVQSEVYTFQNHGYCSEKCIKDNFRYAVLQEKSCGCTNSAPTAEYKLPGSKCTSRCAGYPNDTCGSSDSYTVLNLGGIGSDDDESDSDDSSDDVITTADNTATSATATPTANQTPTSIAKASANEAAASALTTNGIIIPNSVSPDSIPTGILTAASSAGKETTAASSTLSTATHSASSASSSSATPTPTGNAAGTLRAPVAGIFAVGLALVM